MSKGVLRDSDRDNDCHVKYSLVTRRACAGDGKKKKETKLGLTHRKHENFGDWYSEVVVESEMISYYDVSGKASAFLLTSCVITSAVLLLNGSFAHI